MQFAKMSNSKKVSPFQLSTNVVGVQIWAEQIVHHNIASTPTHLSISISRFQFNSVSSQKCVLVFLSFPPFARKKDTFDHHLHLSLVCLLTQCLLTKIKQILQIKPSHVSATAWLAVAREGSLIFADSSSPDIWRDRIFGIISREIIKIFDKKCKQISVCLAVGREESLQEMEV